MERKTLFLASLPAVAVIASAPILLDTSERSKDIEVKANSSNFMTTEDGTRYTVHPDKIELGCPGGKDCIPSIDDPRYEDADEADWMKPGDEIIGVEGEQESLAFPLKILDSHEIVNTEIDNEPIAVTYCPLCRSAVTYSREVEGDVLEFGVSGRLYNANLVMYDRGTETYWSQITGEAIIGPRVPQELDLRYSSITNWSIWKKGHPETRVLSRNTGIYPASSYQSREYIQRGYSNPESFGATGFSDELDKMTLVRGITAGNGSKAYRESDIKREKIIHDRIGGEPVVVMQRPDDGSIIAFNRRINGEIRNFSIKEGGLVDSQGDRWRFNGHEIGGERQLEVYVPQGFYWFAWSKFHPETEIYSPGS